MGCWLLGLSHIFFGGGGGGERRNVLDCFKRLLSLFSSHCFVSNIYTTKSA